MRSETTEVEPGVWGRRPRLREIADAVEQRLRRQDREDSRRSQGAARGPFGGMPEPGFVHEWFAPSVGDPAARRRWLPTLSVLSQAAMSAIEGDVPDEPRAVLWIGRRCWPHPVALAQRDMRLLMRSVFVDALRLEERVWAMEGALRCRDVGAVIGDAQGLDIAESRRLQLAAEAGGTLGLLARPPWEEKQLSVARTRWRVTPDASNEHGEQRWIVELLRCKGLRPISEDARRWVVQSNHATGDVRVAPDVPDRAAAPAPPPPPPEWARRAV